MGIVLSNLNIFFFFNFSSLLFSILKVIEYTKQKKLLTSSFTKIIIKKKQAFFDFHLHIFLHLFQYFIVRFSL